MSWEQIKESVDQMGANFEQFKEANESRLKAIEEKKSGSYENEKLEKMEKGFQDLEKKFETAQTALQRVGTEKKADQANADKEVKSVIRKMMVAGPQALSQEEKQIYTNEFAEVKGLSVDSNEDGGYFVRPAVSSEITSKIFESSPIRQIADVESISTDAWEEVYDDDEPAVSKTSERGARSETVTSKLDMLRISTHEMYAEPILTQKIIDDAAIDVESWHQNKIIRAFGRKEATWFVNGNGVDEAKGLLSYDAGKGFNKLEQLNSGAAADLTADGLIDLQDSLLEEFQPNASWLMRRQTRSIVRKLKDAQGRYLFSVDENSGLNGGAPFSLLGQPIMLAADMPAVAAGSLSVAYGDFKQGYLIIDRIGIRVIRDNLTKKGFVKLYTTKRVGGGVRQFQALKLLKTAA